MTLRKDLSAHLNLRVDRSARTPLYIQIADQIRNLIRAGVLAAGHHLPPERRLAESLGVNRTTVVSAYRELEAEDLVEAHVGRGTTVRPAPDTVLRAGSDSLVRPGDTPPPMEWDDYLAGDRRSRPGALPPRGTDFLLRDIMALCARKDVLSLAAGVPAPELYPVEEFRRIADQVQRTDGRILWQHCPSEGHPPLRVELARYAASRGIFAEPDDIVVLSGSQQGLDLLARVLLEPGDTVLVEAPTFLGALRVFQAAGARVIGVPVDRGGMRIDALENLLQRHRPRLIYTLPTYQNPTGSSLSPERRLRILELAARGSVPVLEDDPYGAFFFEGDSPPPLKSLDGTSQVIYLSTFSKMIFPGLRLGLMAGPRPLVERVTMIKQLQDLHCGTLAQWVLTEFLKNGSLDRHLQRVRPEYRGRRDTMLRSLERHFPHGLEWTRPAGGFYIWCRLTGGVSASDLLAEAAREGVAFVVGNAFYPGSTDVRLGGPNRGEFRLNFTYLPEAFAEEAVRRLARALDRVASNNSHRGTRDLVEVRPLV